MKKTSNSECEFGMKFMCLWTCFFWWWNTKQEKWTWGIVYGPPCSCCNLRTLCFLPHCCSYDALLVTDCLTSLITTSLFVRLPKPREQLSYQVFSLLSCWLSLPRLPSLMKGFWNRGNLSFRHSLGEEINCKKGIKVQLPFQVQFFINDN